MQEPTRMSMHERAARRVILAHAIEAGDTQGRLLGQGARDQIDAQARDAALPGGATEPVIAPERFLDLRAQRVIAAVESRHPSLAALQDPASWQRWLTIGLPLAAVAMGVVTDVVANPHRVDLVSLPLLAIVGWNLVAYLALLLGWAIGRRRPPAAVEARRRRAEGRLHWRRGGARATAEVTALFHLRWQRAARPLSVARLKKVLHLAAAGWAVGVGLSLLARGLVVEYRVGWESTFLDAGQVHAILSLLRLPALLLFPFEPFSVQEVASLRFSAGGGALGGARWVLMYVALLAVVVVLPRLLLAAWSHWRERVLAARVPIDVNDPYYRRVLSLLSAARVHLGLVTHRASDREALLRVLAQEPAAGDTLIRTPQGDVLQLLDLSGRQPPPQQAAGGWMSRLRQRLRPDEAAAAGADPALALARRENDVVLHVVREPADLEAAAPLLQWLGKPVVVLVDPPDGEAAAPPGAAVASGERARAQPLVAGVLSFGEFGRCWVQERVLLEAVGRCLPEDDRPGFERIVAAWQQRNELRLHRAMTAVAEHLLFAARQAQEVPAGALSVKSLLPAERQAQAGARQAAMDEVVKRLDVSAGQMFSRLRELHGLEVTDAVTLQQRLQEKFVVQRSVEGRQAGMAGAATGAAMGASVDLLVGGLTLGAAAALGALVGGSAGYLAAAWKNRATPGGATQVQLSDEMLHALAEAALLRYLAVVHHDRGTRELPASWPADVVAAVEAHRDRLAPFWTAARTQPDPARLASALARELEALARGVLQKIHPRAS
ncbi:MAG: DUF3482 domain-containing protein [Ramlibacter sp.]